MKRRFTLLAILGLSASWAFAAVPANGLIKGVNFSVEGQQAIFEDSVLVKGAYTVPSVDATVSIEFIDYQADKATELSLTPYVILQTGSGFAVGQQLVELPTDSANHTLALDYPQWGDPYLGNYYVSLIVCFMNADMEFYEFDYEPVMFMVSYTTPNTLPAVVASTYPDAENPWEYESFADFYNAGGTARINFTNEVSFNNSTNLGTVTLNYLYGLVVPVTSVITLSESDAIAFGQATSDWNPMDGFWTVSVCTTVPNAEIDLIDNIVIELTGIKSMGQDVQVAPIVIRNSAAQRAAKQAPGTAKVEGIAVDADKTASVYNLQGFCVMKDATKDQIATLPVGLYIIDGKKKFIKR